MLITDQAPHEKTKRFWACPSNWYLDDQKGQHLTHATKEGVGRGRDAYWIAHVRSIKILTWPRGLLVHFQYLVWLSLCSCIFWDRDSTIQELTGNKQRPIENAQIFSLETTWNLALSLELRSLKKLLQLRFLTVLSATASKRLIKIKNTSPSPSKNVVPLTVQCKPPETLNWGWGKGTNYFINLTTVSQ